MTEPVFLQISFVDKGVSKVLFSCHPDDFSLYFNDLVNDISSTKKCEIYYLEDQSFMPDNLDEYYAYIKDISLFVFPITKKFINEFCRAKDVDFMYALSSKVAILPILVEPNLYELFNEKCASIQVLDKTSRDPTQDPYKVKLALFLESVLVDSETAQKIREAFDAYIFLSYRKKDRKYAQEVMSIILKNDFMRDVAIWYDEFLTPGEDFNDEIFRNLFKSKLMTLVVTPNINERYGDRGNYVIEQEYPSATREKKPVLPIEVVKTDTDELKNNFYNIQKPIDKDKTDDIAVFLKEILFKEGFKENNDPQHLFFIGLAYLNGIDTERDVDRAVSILSSSFEKGLIEAGFVLFRTYYNKLFNYPKAIEFAERSIEMMGDHRADYEGFLDEYCKMLYACKYYDKAIQLNRIICELHKSDENLERKNFEANIYFKKENNKKCIEIKYEIYSFCKNRYGLNDELTKKFGNSLLFVCFGTEGQDRIIKELEEDGFDLYERIFKETSNNSKQKAPESISSDDLAKLLKKYEMLSSQDTISDDLINVCSKIANAYYENKKDKEYLRFKEKSYRYAEVKYGINDRKTDRYLKSILALYRDYYVRTKDESYLINLIDLCEHDLDKKKELLGEKNPSSVRSLETLIFNYEFCKKNNEATNSKKELLRLYIEIYGSENPKTIKLQDELKQTI